MYYKDPNIPKSSNITKLKYITNIPKVHSKLRGFLIMKTIFLCFPHAMFENPAP